MTSQLLHKFKEVRSRSTELCKDLQPEDCTLQAVVFTSPVKWHLAHTTWFFEEMILSNQSGYSIFNSDFSFLFNSYYNSIGVRLARNERGLISRPNINEVSQYRDYVDEQMIKLLESDCSDEIKEVVTLGLNHEQQHQELLITDLKYNLAINPMFPKYGEDAWISDSNSETGFLSIEEGIYSIGHNNNDFSFDNELGNHRVFVEPFEISKGLVTNGEYIEFIENEGYTNPFNWLDDGWSWVQQNEITKPLYWHKVDGEWHHYTLAGLQKIDLNAIISHVSFYEASAFATYKEMRLPTEFEWEIASTKFEWGKRWEWTNSAYLPYPKFKIREGAIGEYNGKFMINQMVLRGASVATSKGHSRNTYRNFFQPEMQWQFSGIRLAK